MSRIRMTEVTSADIKAILSSYAPPEAEFTIPAYLDETKSEPPEAELNFPASFSDPKFKSERVEYSYVEPSSRTIKAIHLDIAPLISKAGVRGLVTNVAHGTFHSQPATLIVFSFSLRSGDHGFRFENVHAKITFSKHPSAPQSELGPAILKFAPRKIYGLPTVEGKKNRIGGEISLQVPAGPLTVGPAISGEKESKYEKEHRYACVGNYWSSKFGNDWDIVYWDLKENAKTKHGIPDRLNVALIVEREGAFTASVEVNVDTPVANGIFAFPWAKNRPVAFVPGVVMGQQPKSTKFEELTDAEWRAMIPYEDEWENKFTEER